MRRVMAAGVLTLIFCLGACSDKFGHQFKIPNASQLTLGKTTLPDVNAIVGERSSTQRTWTIIDTRSKPDETRTDFDGGTAPGDYIVRFYNFGELFPRISGGGIEAKSAALTFFNERLVGYSFVDSLNNNSKHFSESQVQEIIKKSMSKSDVKILLGGPDVEAVYPAILNPDESTFYYGYQSYDKDRHETTTKSLVVLFDRSGHTKDARMTNETVPNGYLTMPTYNPARK